MSKCVVCGAPHASCGPRTTVIPVDQRITRKEPDMALKKYEVRGGRRGDVPTVMKLSESDAKRLGGVPVDAKGKTVANKGRAARNKTADPAGSDDE